MSFEMYVVLRLSCFTPTDTRVFAQAAQQEVAVSNARAAELERTTSQARTAAMANGVGVKSRLQAMQIA